MVKSYKLGNVLWLACFLHTFSPERIEEWNRKIKNGRFYSKNESLLEQVKEKERVIDEMYQEDCKKLAKAQEKLEEKCFLI